jgi:hypothetical protein
MRQGAWGGGVVDGPQNNLNTYRREAFGLFAALIVAYSRVRCKVWALLDNESGVNKFNGEPDVYGQHDLSGVDPDLRSLIFALRESLGTRFKLSWQQSHLERRKVQQAYHRHNVGNMWADEIADQSMACFDAKEQRIGLGKHLTWSVAWGGELIVQDIRKSLAAALKSEMFVQYLEHKRHSEVLGSSPQV